MVVSRHHDNPHSMMNKKSDQQRRLEHNLPNVCFLGGLSVLTIPEIFKSLEPRVGQDKML